MGDGGAEGSSAIRDGGQAAISFTPDVDGTGSGSLLVRIFKSSQLVGLYVGDLPYCLGIERWSPKSYVHILMPGTCEW